MQKNNTVKMEMVQILKKVRINKTALVLKKVFLNNEITTSAKTSFVCCNCNFENRLEVIPYVSGFPILGLYEGNVIITRKELLENKIVTETSQWMKHFGELTVNDLPTLYFGTNCGKCNSKYFCVFAYGEKQPGLTILEISGVWEYDFTS